MENADIAKKIRANRPGTFGSTPQAGTPTPQPKRPPMPTPVAKPKVTVEAPKAEVKEETTPAPTAKTETSAIVKGFRVGLNADAKLVLEMHGEAPNYLELVALFDYTTIRKQEILEQFAGTGSVATRSHLLQLTNTVNQLAKGLNGLLGQFNSLNEKVDILHETFIPGESEPTEPELED